jgi:Lon protease-like protein
MTEPTAPSALPTQLPIFPLPGVLLLPRGRLPLNIFEPRYLAMVDAALGRERLIGLVQPATPTEADAGAAPLYRIGCAGRIMSFNETDDGRYLIHLNGVCRFQIQTELPLQHGFRSVTPDWNPYLADLVPPQEDGFDRGRLMERLRQYFKLQGLAADWTALQNAGGEALIAALAMICPFEPNEKQGLLEAPTLQDRAALLIALLEMATLGGGESETARH